MGPCTCGHAPEDHEPECSECPCVHYEDAWGEEDPILEYNQASGEPSVADLGIFYDEAEANIAARDARAAAVASGRNETYCVARLLELCEFDG
jgi:hypothetical protein